MTSHQTSIRQIKCHNPGDKMVYRHDRDLSTDGDYERGSIDGRKPY